eukprot:PhF_6_TR35429/c1_g1_i1/m.51621/K03979/obgE, cgtA; GTPase
MRRTIHSFGKFERVVKKALDTPQTQRKYSRNHPFIDRVKALVSSGRGGDGRACFLHERNNNFGGPAGGNGGRGGNVYLVGSHKESDLSHIDAMGYHLRAQPGRKGMSKNKWGTDGNDLVLTLPLGTIVLDVDSNEVVFDLEQEGGVLLLEGGSGGKGNVVFAHSTNQSPHEFTRGLPGNSMLVQFELKVLADVGLVGYPNAGKSSLLCAATTAQPQVAPYPFTTLQPYVGYLHTLHGDKVSVADLPGLIEGAYANKGLGHQFLRHVERTNTIVYVVDMVDPYVPEKYVDKPQEPWEIIQSLDLELEYFAEGLSERVAVVLANKMDVRVDSLGRSTESKFKELCKRSRLPVMPISAKHGFGIQEAIEAIFPHVVRRKEQKLNEYRQREETYQSERVDKQVERQSWTQGKKKEIGEMLQRDGFEKSALAGYEDMSSSENESLVDQQLDSMFGVSGVSTITSNTYYTPEQSKLSMLRDQSFKGKYWQLTREKGERLPDEVITWPKISKK